uniref:Protein kinase domain-containing protein n=1 Tax=Rhabditophanes sp. KR3021 TaxID=114890 RepID=A0AC35UDN1_9BILA
MNAPFTWLDHALSNNQQITFILNQKSWTVLSFLNEGSFGKIYAVGEEGSSFVGAMKVELNGSHRKFPLLNNEIDHMILLKQLLASNPISQSLARYIPSVYCRGYLPDGSVYGIFELLNNDIQYFKNLQPHSQFSFWTSFWLLREMIRTSKAVHLFNFVHRDIKLNNYCLNGNPKLCRSIVLVDFGLICQDSTANPNYTDNLKGKTVGSLCYSSAQSQCDPAKPSYLDDIWSIFYVSLDNFIGTLPWKSESNKSTVHFLKTNLNLDLVAKHHYQVPKILYDLFAILKNPLAISKAEIHDTMLHLIASCFYFEFTHLFSYFRVSNSADCSCLNLCLWTGKTSVINMCEYLV